MDTYEKKYKEALERAKTLYENANGMILKKWVEQVFPELAESEDERIRKEILEFVTIVADSKSNKMEWIAWLEKQVEKDKLIKELGKYKVKYTQEVLSQQIEKQSEHSLTDKVEPKFKNGQWIVFNGLTLYVKEVVKGFYRTITIDGIPNSYDWDIDNIARLWTIADARDGDVLATENFIFIFSQYEISKHEDDNQFDVALPQSLMGRVGNSIIHYLPATKEQRELLFQKMHEAGYEWDEEKKEVKKIEQSNLTEFEDAVKDMMNAYRDAIGDDDVTTEEVKKHTAYLLSLIPYKSAKWSEEDEIRLDRICKTLWKNRKGDTDEIFQQEQDINWLKSIKQAIEEQQ